MSENSNPLQDSLYDMTYSTFIFIDMNGDVKKYLEEYNIMYREKGIYVYVDKNAIPPSKMELFAGLRKPEIPRLERSPALISKRDSRGMIAKSDIRYQKTIAEATSSKRLLYETILNYLDGNREMIESIRSYVLHPYSRSRQQVIIRLNRKVYAEIKALLRQVSMKYHVNFSFNDLVELTVPAWIKMLRVLSETDSSIHE